MLVHWKPGLAGFSAGHKHCDTKLAVGGLFGSDMKKPWTRTHMISYTPRIIHSALPSASHTGNSVDLISTNPGTNSEAYCGLNFDSLSALRP